MNAEQLIVHLTEEKDESNLCVVLRSGDEGMETLIVADEKGRWSISGGHAKDGETHAQAAKREVKEETGLDVEPEALLWAYHAARDKPVFLFYAVTDQEAVRPGGGDVTKCRWTKLDALGDLNGTDRLAIQVAANRVHNPQGVVDDAVEVAESHGFSVATVAAPPKPVPGIYFRISGHSADAYAYRLSEWSASLNWRVTNVLGKQLYESTQEALERASRCRKLTPMLDCLLHAADALWRYESVIAPRLAEGYIVLEIGSETGPQRFVERGLAPDLAQDIFSRIPRPLAAFTVGEDFDLGEFQVLKDSIEQMKDPDDPRYHLSRITRRNIDVPWKMEFVRDNPEQWDNPVVRCPKCKHEGLLMDDFSYLKSGLNGIEAGQPDDLDAQECGHCGAKMEWDEIADRIVKI